MFVQISVGEYHNCGLKSDSSIVCWGDNMYGEITPTPPNSGFVQVSAGYDHSCALRTGRTLICWGNNLYGESTVPAPDTTWLQVSAGDEVTCAVKSDGSVACWGENKFHMLQLPANNNSFVQVSTGSDHVCGLKSDTSLVCWGNNYLGESVPPAPNTGFTQVSAKGGTCATKNDGTLSCWGLNSYGQAPVISLSPSVFPQGSYGADYGQALSASGGPTPPYTFDVLDGTLPPGLTLSADGTLGGAPTQAGSFNFTIRALDANRYTGTANFTLTIDPAPLTITANNTSRAYGDVNPTFSGVITGLKNGDAITASYTSIASPTSPVGDYAILPALVDSTPAKIANYTVTPVNGALTVEKALLTVTANDLSRPVGSPNPPLTYTITGYRNNDSAAVVTGVPILHTTATLLSPVDTYPITVTGDLSAANYFFSYRDGTLVVLKARLFLPVLFQNR